MLYSGSYYNQYEDDELKCDCLNHNYYDFYDYYDGYTISSSKINFYDHLEKCLLNKSEFNDEILNINLMNTKIECNDRSIVFKLFGLLEENLFGLSLELRLKLLKALFCWQTQFNDIETLNKLAEFSSESSTFSAFVPKLGN